MFFLKSSTTDEHIIYHSMVYLTTYYCIFVRFFLSNTLKCIGSKVIKISIVMQFGISDGLQRVSNVPRHWLHRNGIFADRIQVCWAGRPVECVPLFPGWQHVYVFPLRTVRLKASVHLLGNHLPKSGIDLNQSGPAETNLLTIMDNKRELQEL